MSGRFWVESLRHAPDGPQCMTGRYPGGFWGIGQELGESMSFQRLMAIWFVFLVYPAIFIYTLYDIFVKDNPISIFVTAIIVMLFFAGIRELRDEGKKNNV